jgi:hypothetical protein
MSINTWICQKPVQKIRDAVKVEKLIYYQSYYSGRKGHNMTSEKSTKIENPALRLIAIFYIAVGIAQIGYFAIESYAAPLHLPVLGILSIITAYSLLTMKKWTLPLVVGLFFVGLTFGVTTLMNSVALQTFGGAMLFNLALIAYMILLLITSVYLVIQRKSFN